MAEDQANLQKWDNVRPHLAEGTYHYKNGLSWVKYYYYTKLLSSANTVIFPKCTEVKVKLSQ